MKATAIERYIVFDVETPNSANDRISSIGVVVVEGQSIVREFYTLVNPETHFDAFNISLTGISPEDVADIATFLASDMSSYVTGQVIQVDGGMNM